MPDAGFVISPAVRVVDSSIAAVAGGSIEFYAAGTSTPLTVYSDSTLTTSLGSTVYLDAGGHPVSSQGGSTKVVVYTGAALIKMTVKDSSSVTLATYDNVRCAQDTSGLGGGASSGSGLTGIVSKTNDFSVDVTTDDGKLFNCDPTGAAFTATFGSAVTAGDGFTFGLRHAGVTDGDTAPNAVKYTTTSAQAISQDGKSVTASALTACGEEIWFGSNGASWVVLHHTPPRIVAPMPIHVADRLTAPPTTPEAGAYYIINGTPTGAWASYADEDLVRATGQGGWTRWTPPTDCGWLAYVADENMLVQFRGSAWVDLSNVEAPAATALGYAEFEDQKSNGTVGGTATVNAWTARVLNTQVTNSITGCSLATNQITIPAGTYYVAFSGSFLQTATTQIRLKSTTTSTHITSPTCLSGTADGSADVLVHSGILVLASAEIFELQYLANNAAGGTSGLGSPSLGENATERYASVRLLSLSAPQGPQGAQGSAGTLNAGLTLATALANGVNSDIAITSGGTSYGKLRVTGPSGAFSISGFAAPSSDNYRLTVFNTVSQTMTLTNDATSTAANRILTMTGADVALTGPSMIEFVYDSGSARWIYMNG